MFSRVSILRLARRELPQRQTVVLYGALLVTSWIWYCIAADYGYNAVSGTFSCDGELVHSTLILRRDRSFEQKVEKVGHTERTHGRWQRIGEGGVVFSKEFLRVGGQKPTQNGEVYGHVKKGFGGLFVSTIEFAQQDEGPVFHKEWFR